MLLPVWDALFKFVTRMDRCIVDDNDGLLRDRLTKRIKTGNHHACVDGFFKHIRMQIIVSIHKQFPLLTWSPPLHLNKTLCGWLTPPSRSKRVGILAKMPAIGCQEVTLFVL